MNGANISRRSVYDNEQKPCDSGNTINLGTSVAELGKNEAGKTIRSCTVDLKAFHTRESIRDMIKKKPVFTEDRQSILESQNDTHFLNNQAGQLNDALYSSLNPARKPINFGTVAPGIFRSSFPNSEDFQYLQSLSLKTILSLVKKDFSPEFQGFVEKNNINHKVIDMAGTKKVEISDPIMKYIMSIVLDQSNYPILIHCNHGRHRTGCTVAVLRHVLRWDLKKILQEYCAFAAPKERICDIEYITNFNLPMLGNIMVQSLKIRSQNSRLNLKTWRMLFLSVVIIFIFTTLRCFKGITLRT